jgi:small subunit ribosomal protein S20
MPVTKTAKRALRSSKKKTLVNTLIKSRLESAIRIAKKQRSAAKIREAVSLADRAAKKGLIHKNKAARIKKLLAKLSSKRTASAKRTTRALKKTAPAKKK